MTPDALRNALFCVLLPMFCYASSVHADPLSRIADDVVRDTVFDLPATKEDPQPTRYNLWMYQNFMILEGMDALGEATGNEQYKTYANRNIDFFAAYQSKFGDSMTAGPAGTGKWYSKPREMWQCGMIAAFAERQRIRPNPEFVKGMATFDALLDKSPTFSRDGVLVRRKSQGRGLGLQIDDLYMITPYWCRKAELLWFGGSPGSWPPRWAAPPRVRGGESDGREEACQGHVHVDQRDLYDAQYLPVDLLSLLGHATG
jgi:hypothetical protein